MLFTGLIAVPAVGYWRFGMNEVFAFWFAYILTRPLGASFADWLAVTGSWRPWARIRVGELGVVVIAGLVGYLTVTDRDVQGRDVADPAPSDLPRSDAVGDRSS